MQYKNFKIKLNLNKFIDSRVVEIDGIDGDKERGLFIPFDKNGLSQFKNGGVYITAFANISTIAKQNWYGTHYILLDPSSKQKEKMEDLGYKVPIIGSMGVVKAKFNPLDKNKNDIYAVSDRVKRNDYED